MKKKKDLTPLEIERRIHDWKAVSPEKGKRLQDLAKKLAQDEREKQRKDAVFTARVRQEDLDGFKEIAERKRIPYQTLLGHIIHAYVEGTLVDVDEVRKVFTKKRKAG